MTDSVEANLRRGLAGHPTADPVLEAVTKRIVQITRHYERAMREVTARHGISLGDAEVLFTLAHSQSPQHTPGELARTFQITPGSMTTRLARLERAGYIERHIDLTNRRRQLIADALPARELSKLNTQLNRILSHIERDHTPDPPIRPPAKSS